jgi:flagellar FliL protein
MINDLIINPAASGGRRHLMVSLGLEYADPLLKVELENRDPQIRDNLITLLAGQDANVLTDIRYRESIRQSLLKAVNYYLESGTVEKVYFTKYVFQ